jgi:UDP-glucuronate 4-epimerase
MKILVTGSAGFIGFYLVKRLIRDGHRVVGLDNINDYYDVNLKCGRLAETGIAEEEIRYNSRIQSSWHANYSFLKLNLEDLSGLLDLFQEESFDMVVNLAAQPGIRYSLLNPHAYISSNIVGYMNILECCRKYPVRHLIYASSSSVYGLNRENIFSTADAVDHPVSLYAASKRANELMAHTYSHLYNIPTTGLRFFTVYGPWSRPDMALFLFTKSILENKPISVYNYGDMYRDFTYIDDIIEGIVRVLNHPPTASGPNGPLTPSTSPAPFKIYNIGNNSPVKLLDFIDILERELGIEAKRELLPLQPGDVYSTFADVNPLIEELGYKPSTPLEEGVKEFVGWYRNFYKT